MLGETEINELDLTLIVIHDVFGLNVSMDYVFLMSVNESAYDLIYCLCSHVLAHLPLVIGQLLEQLAARAKLHDEVYELLILVGLIILNDVWVINFLQDGDFLMKGLDILLRELRFGDDLNGNLQFFVGLVLPKEDLPEAAGAQYLADVVKLLKFLGPSTDGLLSLDAVTLLLLAVGCSCRGDTTHLCLVIIILL